MMKKCSSASRFQMVVILRVATTVLIFLIVSPLYSQKLAEPKFLGSWTGGEDPSEFLIHKILETSADLLKENPGGELIVRICTSDDFPKAFVKTTLNPLSVNSYNQYRPTFPEERIFVSRHKACAIKASSVHNEYWFAPNGKGVEHDELLPLSHIRYRTFIYSVDSEKSRIENDQGFNDNIMDFVNDLRNNQKTKGLIVYSSANEKMRHSIEKVKAQLKREKIDLGRIETVEARYPGFGGEMIMDVYPNLATFVIKPV